jgi:hypothetical protein
MTMDARPDPRDPLVRAELTRRALLGRSARGLGGLALSSLLGRDLFARAAADASGGLPGLPHFAPRAKRVIYLFMSGAPSHMDLFDEKPLLREREGEELPPSVRGGQRITGMTSTQTSFPVVGPAYGFRDYGACAMRMSELLPGIGGIADEIALIRSMHTEPINHDPAVTFLLSGNQQPGRPVMGSWVAYGLGSESRDLPEYVVMLSGSGGQPLLTRYWHNGFLPSRFQGVQFRGEGDPVLFLEDPDGMPREVRRAVLDGVRELNALREEAVGDPDIAARIASYEMAWRMQSSVPELTDLSSEPAEVLELYGADPSKPSFANNCLLARRLAERGVRFIQLYHRDWDHHANLPAELKKQCEACDRPSAALVSDLKRLGLLEDTLVIWGGEFGRTAYSQGPITGHGETKSFGRDHHPRCFSMWLAGGGVRRGLVVGATDDYGYNITEHPIHVHDLQATVLACLGVDHTRLTFRHQGRDFRLTDVAGRVLGEILA